MKAVYAKGNILIRKFSLCSDEVKTQLFTSFCSNMYCSALWSHYKASSHKNVIVGYNNVYRYLLKVKGPCSISQLFLTNGVNTFKILFRKSVYSLLSRASASFNILVKTIVNSTYFIFESDLFKKWQSCLYTI